MYGKGYLTGQERKSMKWKSLERTLVLLLLWLPLMIILLLIVHVIDDMFTLFADEDVVDIRRYGLFKQISGKIYKQFDKKIHVISASNYFPNGIPHLWIHARGIDYHEQNPWAIGWMSMSSTNEAFIWNEYNPSPSTIYNS